jgi:hypothetical protein
MSPLAPDPQIVQVLKGALGRGITAEESRKRRRDVIHSFLGTVVALAAVLLLTRITGGPGGWLFAAAFVVMSAVTSVFRYRQLAPRPPQEIGEKELAALATMHALCRSCGALIGRYSLGCGVCGALRRPRVAVAGVVLLAVATVLMLIGIWVKSGRY